MSKDKAEKLGLFLLMVFGLWSTYYFGIWWFRPEHIQSLPLFILLSCSLWFFILRSTGYWLLFFYANKPKEQIVPLNLTVDVMTTAAPGEPIEMTQTCLLALKNITYPHETYLLDDSKNLELKSFCQVHEIHYIARNNKKDAKCGNVNNGLRYSNGEFILIIDPDHIVQPNYLDRVLGHFNDPNVGFVQTAQAYYNQEKSFVAKGGAEQTYLFYGPVLSGMGALGTNLAIGTNCTFRRTALESINLYKPGLAEDLHTSMALHSKGWKSVYVPEILARGLTPEDLSSFLHQQLKWSRGVLELLMNNFITYAKGWSWLQRGLYLLSASYYFESVMITINLILPLIYIWFHLMPVSNNLNDFIIHFSPWLLINLGLFFYVQRWLCDPRERGLMWRGMLLQFIVFPIHLLGIIYALIGKQIPYLPTAKTPSDIFPVRLLTPQLGLILITLLGWIFNLYQSDEGLYQGMSIFSGLNVILIIVAIAFPYISHKQQFNKVK